jgi:hypothetical protein
MRTRIVSLTADAPLLAGFGASAFEAVTFADYSGVVAQREMKDVIVKLVDYIPSIQDDSAAANAR